ncbi:MAG: hypothetical protein J5I50_08390 [Chitinophagaceae bacterium]|nr:hypothetical protein [Chitinophagaceae bacterium]
MSDEKTEKESRPQNKQIGNRLINGFSAGRAGIELFSKLKIRSSIDPDGYRDCKSPPPRQAGQT